METPLNKQQKKDLITRMLKETSGIKKVAYAALEPYKVKPHQVCEELREFVPKERLPEVVLQLRVNLVSEGADEEPLVSFFPEELKEAAETRRKMWEDFGKKVGEEKT